MKLLKLKSRKHAEDQDVQRLLSICLERGYSVSADDIETAWEMYSDTFWAAGWMSFSLFSDDEIFSGVMRYLEEKA